MTKKNIFLIVILIAAVLLPLIVIIYLQQTSVSNYSSKFQKLTADNGWSKPKDYEGCKKDQKNCITIATALIDDGTYSKAYYSGYDIDSLQTEVNKIYDSVDNKKFKQAYKQSRDTVKSVNKSFNNYIEPNQGNFDQIDKLLYVPDSKGAPFTNVNYQIVGDWAKVTMLSSNRLIMSASVILKKTNNKWGIIAGPGTSFDSTLTKGFPDIPNDFLEGPQKNGSAIVVVNKNGKTPPTSSLTGSSPKASVSPLSSLLPYYTNTYVVESEMVNGLPIYTVSYYKTTGNTLEKTKSDFHAWLKKMKVEIKDSSIIYKDIDEPDKSQDSINVVD